MVAFGDKLGAQGVEDLVAYLRDVQGDPEPFEPPRAMRPPPIPLGPVPLNPKGPEPKGFTAHPAMTPVDIVQAQLKRHARFAILDARAPSDYANEHIAGAVSVPFYDPAPYLSQLPKNTWLICYCACPHAESGILAIKLKENGFKKVSVLAEGLGVWKTKGYPTTSGIEP
jgi:cytochrome c oxidase cbb3-type subunit 3/ubiquinol-cytochrome c reductase cytochrome c subunit